MLKLQKRIFEICAEKKGNIMFELLTVVVFLWLMLKAIKLVLKLTWGLARFAVSILIGLAFPVLVICFLFAGSVALLVPLAMVCVAIGIMKACF